MNKVMLVGNLTRDPEIGTTNGGISYCRFTLAVSRRFKKQDGTYDTDFISCIAWRQQADFIYKYFRKGSKMGLVGTIQTGSYEKDGQRRYTTDILVEDVEFVTPKNSNSNNDGYQNNSYSQNQPNEQAPKREKATMAEMEPMEDDDLPF